MKVSRLRLAIIALFALIAVSVISAFSAGINVPASNVGQQVILVSAEEIKLDSCRALYLTNIVRGFGTLIGTSANDLIIGNAVTDTIDGSGGDDCILGSGGDDILIGSEGNDICVGGDGSDTFTDCEVEIQ